MKKFKQNVTLDTFDVSPANFRLSKGKVYFVDLDAIKPKLKGMGMIKCMFGWAEKEEEREKGELASMHRLLKKAAALIIALLALSTHAAKKPNILFIMSDDHASHAISAYGSQINQTPNIDRLAREGLCFTDAYSASPVCTPTRVSILTGKHPARLHMTIWRESALNRGNRKLLQPICLDSLPLKHVTLTEVLKKAGYFNAHLGKWHVGRAEAYPQAHGFHVNIGGTLWGAPQTFWYNTYFMCPNAFDRITTDFQVGQF